MLAATLGILLAGPARAQDGPAAAAKEPARTITVQNLTRWARREWVRVVVPFAAGAVHGAPERHVEGCPTRWEAFGARWPDGSWRQGLCLFRPALSKLEEKRLELLPGPGPDLPEGAPRRPEATLTCVVRTGGRTVRADLEPTEVLIDGEVRRVELLRARVGGTGLVAEAVVESWRGQDHAACSVAVFFSDPRTKVMQLPVGAVVIRSRGRALVLHHARPFGVRQETLEDGSRVVLLRDTVLGDGQGVRRAGVLVPEMSGAGDVADATLRAAVLCPLLAATDWHGFDTFGPYGRVPDPPPWLGDRRRLRAHLARRHAAFAAWSRARGGPFRAGEYGLAKNPGQTGDQGDFGLTALEEVAGTGLPSPLHELEASVLQEACRPVHFFEADGSPVRPADHPQWVVWSGRTHWHCDVSRDRLGKPCPAPRFETHGWGGKDRQHWSSNYLCAYTQLTGSPWVLREVENEVRLYLAGQTVDPALTTSGAGAPRGAGRTLRTASWLYLCTGDEALRRRMVERLEKVHLPGWVGRELPPDRVRPFGLQGPDARVLDGEHTSWLPWQESLAAVGFWAAHRVTGNEAARALARGLAFNTLRHGWRVDDEGAMIATAIRWREGGVPPTAEALRRNDPAEVQWSHGTAFSLWSIGAVRLARRLAAEEGKDDLVTRADRILAHMTRQRSRPSHDGFDRFGRWDALR